jgi:capsular polysaccharide transport system permease protein
VPSPVRRFKTARTVAALLLREMGATYGRSSVGYLWAILEPVAGIFLMTFVFSLAFRAPPMGNSFAFFYASGFLPFVAYLDISQKVGHSIRFSRPLLFYPGVTYFDALAARFLLNAMTQVLVIAIVIAGMIPALGIEAILDLPAIGLALLMVGALALGIGTLNCFLIEMFPSWERIWAILNRPMFIISAIFFVFDSVPMPYRDWLWYNPLAHIVGQMRKGFYPTYEGAYVSPLYVFGVSAVCLLAGLLFLGRYHRDLVNG